MVFAIDSVLTAVGPDLGDVGIIIIAMTIAIGAMMFYAGTLVRLIEKHPSIKMLALSFLVLVGVLLIADGFGQEFDRNYVYFAILFSLGVEALNFRAPGESREGEARDGTDRRLAPSHDRMETRGPRSPGRAGGHSVRRLIWPARDSRACTFRACRSISRWVRSPASSPSRSWRPPTLRSPWFRPLHSGSSAS